MDLENIKELIAHDQSRIKLHDEIATITNEVISRTNEENFPVDQDWSEEEFKRRIKEYENITFDLCSAQVMISYWGKRSHVQTIVLPVKMIADYWLERKSVRSLWHSVAWYINFLLLYYTGIAAVASGRYENLEAVTGKLVYNPKRPNSKTTMLQAIFGVCDDYEKQFRIISGNPNHYVPRSEYLFEHLRPKFEELIYLGSDYEFYFDRFEVILALIYVHQTVEDSPDYFSAPIGRFGYKRRSYEDPLSEFLEEAKRMGKDWAPLRAGLFGDSFSRFEKISSLLKEKVKNLRW